MIMAVIRMVVTGGVILALTACLSPRATLNQAFEAARKQSAHCSEDEGQSYYDQTLCIETVYKSTVPTNYAHWSQLNETLLNIRKFGRYADQTNLTREEFDQGIRRLWQESSAAQVADLKHLEAERSQALDAYIEEHNGTDGTPVSPGNGR